MVRAYSPQVPNFLSNIFHKYKQCTDCWHPGYRNGHADHNPLYLMFNNLETIHSICN